MKKIIKIILVIAIVISTVFIMGRYGWKLAGFKLCQNSMIYDEEDDLNLETFVITKNKGNKKYEKVNPKDLSVSKPFISYYADGYKGYDIFQYIFDLDNYKK